MSGNLPYSKETQEKIHMKIEDPSNKTGLPSASLMYVIIDMLGTQANMIQVLQETIQQLVQQSQ